MSDSIPTQFDVKVAGIGEFTVRWRNMRAQLAIEVEYSRLTEGSTDLTEFVVRMASAMADLKVLVMEGPKGWNVDALDPFEDADFAKMMNVWGAIRQKEQSFRGGPDKDGDKGKGPGVVGEPAILVP